MSLSDSSMPPQEGDLNLATHRMTDDVWSRSDREARRQAVVPYALGVGACLIAARAVGGRRWRGALVAGLSAGAAVWVALNPARAQTVRRRLMMQLADWTGGPDLVGEASEESFPASDPPSFTPAVGTGLRREPTMH